MRRRRRFVKKKQIEEGKKSESIWKDFSKAYAFGATLLTGMAVGFVIGRALDVWLNTGVIFTLGFVSLGIFVAFDILIKDIFKHK